MQKCTNKSKIEPNDQMKVGCSKSSNKVRPLESIKNKNQMSIFSQNIQ